MRVLGIDPGSTVCGWAVVETTGHRVRHLAHGAVRLTGELPDRLLVLFDALEEVVEAHAPEVVAVEGVFTQRNARSALVLGHARGVALLAAARRGLAVHEYAPATVKKAVVGTGRAEKAQVGRMVAALLSIEAPRVHDAADALAVAICHVQHGARGASLSSSVVRHRKAGGR